MGGTLWSLKWIKQEEKIEMKAGDEESNIQEGKPRDLPSTEEIGRRF